MYKGTINIGDIYWVSFDPSVGHEFQGKRPALVVQSKAALRSSNLVTVIPFTSNINNKLRDDILVPRDSKNNLFKDSILKVHDIMSFDYSRFIKKKGVVSKVVMSEVKDYLRKHFSLA